jgi:hypothetical protein
MVRRHHRSDVWMGTLEFVTATGERQRVAIVFPADARNKLADAAATPQRKLPVTRAPVTVHQLPLLAQS